MRKTIGAGLVLVLVTMACGTLASGQSSTLGTPVEADDAPVDDSAVSGSTEPTATNDTFTPVPANSDMEAGADNASGDIPLQDAATLTRTPLPTCNRNFPARLEIGDRATVIVFQVSVRTEPGLDSPQADVGYFSEGRQLDVTGGPVCADDLWWYEVYSAELDAGGWVVEADDENYFLAP